MPHVIRHLPILDLRKVSSHSFELLDAVEDVRTVILAPTNAAAFAAIDKKNVRSQLVVYPHETLVVGQLEFDETYLNTLADQRSLVVVGHVFVGTVPSSLLRLKIKSLRMYGQIFFSCAITAGVLQARLERLQGQILEIPPDSLRWVGPTLLDKALLNGRRHLHIVSIGTLTIAPNVTPADLVYSIEAMTQVGELRGRELSIAALLSICKRRLGDYSILTSPVDPKSYGTPPASNETGQLVQIDTTPSASPVPRAEGLETIASTR
jgi:hypothetical protein